MAPRGVHHMLIRTQVSLDAGSEELSLGERRSNHAHPLPVDAGNRSWRVSGRSLVQVRMLSPASGLPEAKKRKAAQSICLHSGPSTPISPANGGVAYAPTSL